MFCNRISEASIFELVKNKFSDDAWVTHSSSGQQSASWQLMIDIAKDSNTNWSDDGEYYIEQYPDRTLRSFKVYNPDLDRKVRPSQRQLRNLFEFLTRLEGDQA